MPAVFVIYRSDDASFVRDHVLPPLRALGFDRMLTASPGETAAAAADQMRRSAAVLAVVPRRAAGDLVDTTTRQLIATARDAGRPVILVPRRDHLMSRDAGTEESPTAMDEGLAACPAAEGGSLRSDGTVDDTTLWRSLADLLPSAAAGGVSDEADEGAPLPWNETAFSKLLADAVARLDHHRSQVLVAAFTDHVAAAGREYPVGHAQNDLKVLRKKRQFTLMQTYAAAALRTGTSDFTVRRQYAQALIELREYDAAREVLERLIADVPRGHFETYEARGLLGRLHKQLYVNAPEAAGSATNLQRAIEVYGGCFREDPQQTWPGINTASLLIRAARDGVTSREWQSPATVASGVLAALDDRRKSGEGKPAYVWDLATRVEALVALGNVKEAQHALDEYLAHPDMDAFEVSSTYRQFDEVLQLGRDPRTRPLLERLWRAVQRHRTTGTVVPDGDEPGTRTPVRMRRLLLGVSDPAWNGQHIPGLTIHARMGNILTISGSEDTVKALMKDPLVVSVEESRPAAPPDCVRSRPFINLPDNFEFQGTTGPFTEKGDHALVALIDDGIDVLHEAFLDGAENGDNRKSRIVGIWDQGVDGTPPPGFDFGTYYDAAAIAKFVAERGKASPDVPARLRNVNGHGTHVASIAAGGPTAKFAGGMAPNARILVVISAGSDPTGYSSAHVAALQFIDATAASLDLPVVVNVSQGMNAGAHDGKSLVEVAFDGFSKGGRMPGRVVVKSAGNERDTRGHAEMQLGPEEQNEFRWTCKDEFWVFDRLELWWNSANEYHFRLRAPNGEQSPWLTMAEPAARGRLDDVKYRMEFVRHHVDNGDSRLTVDLGSGTTPISAGEWAIEVLAVTVPEEDALHAWIERRNGPRSEFVGLNVNERMTLSIPGTASSVITVAAIDAANPVVVGQFSSYGPTRDGRRKPDVCAPGVKVIAARGGTLDDSREDTGTSMAAPHVAGAIALVLSKRARAGEELPSATQLGAVIHQNTLKRGSRWTPGQGYGVIDVAALLKAF